MYKIFKNELVVSIKTILINQHKTLHFIDSILSIARPTTLCNINDKQKYI